MKQVATKAILAILIGAALTVVSLTYRQPFADPHMSCPYESNPLAWLTEQSWRDSPNYFTEGYPFTARQEPTETSCDTTQYLWFGAAADVLFWSLLGLLMSIASYPLLTRLGRLIRRLRISTLRK